MPDGSPPHDVTPPLPILAPTLQRRVIAARYELQELLGSGGMGRVFRAHDTRLKRSIALKLLLGAGPEASRRLLQEAQAQARVEHEHVCRVYEVGWDDEGEPFIVMQLIEGRALSDVAAELSFEQRARLMLQVAEAVHAANRLGVIHRDLKPGNVLVERSAEGVYRPYVTDFGLARSTGDVTSDRTGSVVGTPNYMAPEQARGDVARIDRRTDVYGLGATLYEVLSGRFPFEGTAYDVLTQVLRHDPTALHKLDASIPRDLAAISRKCMHKEPGQRYDSARALAEDLQRWLDGEPILAQPPNLAYRARRLIERHRALSLAVAAVLLVTVGGGAWALRARSRARQMAERFGQDVKEIEGRMRFALVLPLHDISEEEGRVRQTMARVEHEMKPLGSEGIGPGEYALGRGALVLGDAETARAHFQKAWDHGYQSPETATGLGLSLIALYRAGLHDADRITDKALREHRRRELTLKYRVPAKAALQAGAGATTEPAEYVEALMQFCDEEFDGAEKVAQDALLQAPWLYEARILLGQIHHERGLHHRAGGDDAGAAIEFTLAESPLKIAVQFGRSDPRTWGELCSLLVDELELGAAHGGGTDEAPPGELFEVCDNGTKAAPHRVETWLGVAEAQRTWAEMRVRAGLDAGPALTKALSAARQALTIRPDDADAAVELGLALRLAARDGERRGGDPAPQLEEAAASLQRALNAHPDSVQTGLSLAHVITDQAVLELQHGRDASAALSHATQLFEHAQALDPQTVAPQSGLGRVALLQAQVAKALGEEPLPAIDHAIQLLQGAATTSGAPFEYVLLASAHALRAEREEQLGQDPSHSVQAALGALERQATPERHWPKELLVEASAQTTMAQFKQRLHGDSSGFEQLARAALSEAVGAGHRDAEAQAIAARLDALEAARRPQKKRTP